MISATSRLTKYQPPNRQNGAVLVVGLLILLVLTLIGVNAMQGTLFEQKMAANTRDRNLAFQNAESALRDAEIFVGGLVSLGNFDGTAGLFGLADPEPDYSLTPTWDDPANNVVSSGNYGAYQAPRYIIKRFTTVTGTEGAMTRAPRPMSCPPASPPPWPGASKSWRPPARRWRRAGRPRKCSRSSPPRHLR